MKLLYNAASPFARKVRIVAFEKAVADQIELVPVQPWPEPTTIVAFNPLGKIPVLVRSDGVHIFDSPVICEYIDSLNPHRPLIPATGEARWNVLRLQALADGILDAAVSLVLEGRRPEAQRSPAMSDRYRAAIRRAIATLPRELDPGKTSFDLGQIAVACVVGYLEFRLPTEDFELPESVGRWWATVRTRASLAATHPALQN
jgi:glutathione S-transferase